MIFQFANEAPAVMQLFHSHGISCDRIETEALKLTTHGPVNPNEDEPLKVYNDMLDSLGKFFIPSTPITRTNNFAEALQKEAGDLQSLIIKLTNTPVATTQEILDEKNTKSPTTVDASLPHSQITAVFAACLPILRARSANLALAQELVDAGLENASLSLRMESMGLV
jgi:hypothetical protein